MKKIAGFGLISVLAVIQTLAGCASHAADRDPPYQVGASSAIYAGSPIPVEKTRASVDLYFGQHVVRSGGGGRGCCYSTGMAGGNEGKPRGGLLALWAASEYGDEKVFSENLQTWLRKSVDKKFYYAVAQQSRLAPYPAKAKGHQSYGIYVSAGRVVVSEAGLQSESAQFADKIESKAGDPPRYVFGRDDTLYYKIIPHGSDTPSLASDPSPWNEVPGVAITEAQYFELRKCGGGRECRWYLSPSDPDLTPEQREYVRNNPFGPEDMKPMLKDQERIRRQHDRWI